MKLQKKSLLVFVGLLIAFLLVISVFFSTVLLASYSALEEQYVEKDLNQAVNKLNDELFSMSSIVSDWGPWDDTVDFVNGKDPNYLNSNLQPYGFDNLNLNLIIITNTNGEVLFSGTYDLNSKVMVPVPAYFSGPLDLKNPLMNMSDTHQITSGIVMLPDAPMLVVSQPIVHSDYSGPPQGVIIMGRYLNNEEIARLAALTRPSLTFTRIDNPALSTDLVSRIRDNSGSAPGIIQQLNANQVAGYALIRDIYGNDALVLQITEDRNIYHQGINTTVQVILIILAGGLFLGILVIILLDREVLKRLGSLALQVNAIGKSGSTGDHVVVEGDDELSELATEINRMLKTIELAQQKVLVSEARFRELAELLPLIIFEMDTDGNLTYVNKAGFELFGVTDQKITQGINIRHYLSTDNIEQMQRGLSAVMSGAKSPGEIYTLKQLDGNLMRAIVSTSLIHREGRVTGFRGIVIDISERIRLEEALTESEEYLQSLIWSVRVGIIVIDTSTHTIIDVNPAALEMMGTTKDAVINQQCHKVFCPSEAGRCPVTDLDQTVENVERTLIAHDGREISIIKYVVPVMLHGKPCLLETFIDNTYRKQIELKLAESEEKYRALAENSADIIFSIDEKGIFTYISPQVSRYGYTPGEIVGKGIQQFIHPDDQAKVLNNYHQELYDRLSISSTFRIVDKQGALYWIEENSNIKRDELGNSKGMVGILRDVTDRVRAEDELRQSRERLENILKASPVVVFETDPEGNFLFASDLWEQLIGYPFEKMKGRHWAEVVHPQDRTRLAHEMRTQSRERGMTGAEARIIRPDGFVLWVLGQSVTVYNPDGSIRGHVGTITDITERKLAEEALRGSEHRFDQLAEQSGTIAWEVDASGLYTYVNHVSEAVWGYRPDELVGRMHFYDLHPESGREAFKTLAFSIFDQKEPFWNLKNTIINKDGHEVEVSTNGIPLLNPDGILLGYRGSDTDITERKRAEEEIIRTLSILKSTMESTADGILVADGKGGIVLFNVKFREMWSFPEAIVVSKDDNAAINFVIDQLREPEIFLKTVKELYEAPEKISFDILELKDGRVFERYSQPQRIGDSLSGRVWSFRDITERKRAEKELAESEGKYRALTENTGDILFSMDMAGIFTYISPQVNKYGFLVEEIIGKTLHDVIHPEDIARVENDLSRDLEKGAQFHSTFRVLDKWGHVHWFDEKGTLRLDQSGKPIGIYGVLRDDSERRRAEDALGLANKKLNLMNNITRHDILNTITGIYGCVDMAKATNSPIEREHLLNDIKDLIMIIQRQITFTREYQEVGVNLPQWQNVNDIIHKALQNFAKSGITFSYEFERMEIYADPLLEKVFYNLVDNAIRYGETITTITISSGISDKGFSLVFKDDGVGVETGQKQEIFKRGVGKNTGMGLFLTSEILAITGITIEENGIFGAGARFEIRIPNGTWRFFRD